MGVPSFYRFLFDTFGEGIMYHVQDGKHSTNDDENLPSRSSSRHRKAVLKHPKMDPKQQHFDNLYLDMNGIIHPCCHPESGTLPKDEDEMLSRVLSYVDRIVDVIRPKSLLYLSVDGVAPRAKLNQQRARRFTSGMESTIKQQLEQKQLDLFDDLLKKFFDQQQLKITNDKSESNENESDADDDDDDDESEQNTDRLTNYFASFRKSASWDHNVITPGTPFMQKVTMALHFYAVYKINTDAERFGHLRIIVDDASVPGEGEHKIIQYIRSQRQDPACDGNITHVIHGLDADLVMLSLLLHEPKFYILREDVFDESTTALNHPMYLFDVGKLRKCIIALFSNLLPVNDRFTFDFERLIDDFVFLCLFVGNDFVPHVPGLSIKENGLPFLLSHYITRHWEPWMAKQKANNTNKNEKINTDSGYFTSKGELNLDSIIPFLANISNTVDGHWFNTIREYTRKVKQNDAVQESKSAASSNDEKAAQEDEEDEEAEEDNEESEGEEEEESNEEEKSQVSSLVTDEPLTLVHAKKRQFFSELAWKASMDAAPDQTVKEFYDNQLGKNLQNLLSKTITHLEFSSNVLNRSGREWRNEYYSIKFNVPESEVPKLRQQLVSDYIQAMAWVWSYYTTGIKSWVWFFPHHHAPLLSEFKNSSFDFTLKPFKLGAPVRPFVQLMAVMPKTSLHCVPPHLQKLVAQANNPLEVFYPESFQRDSDCMDVNWKMVPLLPFMDIELLKSVVKPLVAPSKLSPEEQRRNSFGHAVMYFHKNNTTLTDHYQSLKNHISNHSFSVTLHPEHLIRLDSSSSATISGYIYPIATGKHILSSILPAIEQPFEKPAKFNSEYFKSITTNHVHSAVFYAPAFELKNFYLHSNLDSKEMHDVSGTEQQYSFDHPQLGHWAAIKHSDSCANRARKARSGQTSNVSNGSRRSETQDSRGGYNQYHSRGSDYNSGYSNYNSYNNNYSDRYNNGGYNNYNNGYGGGYNDYGGSYGYNNYGYESGRGGYNSSARYQSQKRKAETSREPVKKQRIE